MLKSKLDTYIRTEIVLISQCRIFWTPCFRKVLANKFRFAIGFEFLYTSLENSERSENPAVSFQRLDYKNVLNGPGHNAVKNFWSKKY